jgi:hypothetical protein
MLVCQYRMDELGMDKHLRTYVEKLAALWIAFNLAFYVLASASAGDGVAGFHAVADTADSLKLWEDDFSGDWTDRWSLRFFGLRGEGSTSTFEQDGETWLRVHFPEGEVGDGVSFRTREEALDQMYLEYKVRFPADFDWVRGGKLPGLSGGTGATGGNKPDGTDGWSIRFMWAPEGKIHAYVYWPDQPGSHGTGFFLDTPLQKGEVQTLGLEVVMNTPGQADGIVRAWLDGHLALEKTDFRFRDVSDLQIDRIHFDTFFGGGDSSWAPTKDEHIDFGDLKLYSAPLRYVLRRRRFLVGAYQGRTHRLRRP